MKKLILLCIVLISINQKVLAQGAFPTYTDNPTWHIINAAYGSFCSLNIIKPSAPISLCTNTYFPVLNCDYNGNNCNIIGYYRVDGSKVYVRQMFDENCIKPEKLMYDFSLQIGDTLRCPISYCLDSTKFWNINNMSSVYQGINRLTSSMKYYRYYNQGPVFNTKWIQGIGSDLHPFYPFMCFDANLCESYSQFIKATVNGSVTYLDTIIKPQIQCLSWVGIKNNSENLSIKVYPKITNVNLYIDNSTSIGKYQLTNIMGELVTKGNYFEGKNTINVKNLISGIYFINLIKEGEIIYQSKIIKED